MHAAYMLVFGAFLANHAAAQSEPRINGLTHSEMQEIQAESKTFDCTKIADPTGRSRCESFLTLKRRCPEYRWVVGKKVLETIDADHTKSCRQQTYFRCAQSFHTACVKDDVNEGLADCRAIVKAYPSRANFEPPSEYEIAHKSDNELARSEKTKFEACRAQNPVRDQTLAFNDRMEGDRLGAELMIRMQTQALKDPEAAANAAGVTSAEVLEVAPKLIAQAKRTLDDLMSAYKALGGTAVSPDDMKQIPDPCGALIPKHQETHLTRGEGFECD